MPEDTVPLRAEWSELEPGTDVAGYVVDGKIGEGGMGSVYGAHHPRIGKRVAIKVLARSYCNDASAVARFEQEARLVNEIRHPNIVDVFQFGELPDKRSFFVMEHLSGENLSDRIASAPLTLRETIEILDAVCDALEAAHEHGVVHRDLKSDNVFLVTTRGKSTVKLLDFGVAKLSGRELSSVGKTASGIVVGTPAYMSPEQARGQPVGPRTDVYQLGILAYKMLTRSLPFDAANPFDLIVEHLKTPPPSPKKRAPGTPDVLARLVVRMMAKSPDERPTVPEVRAVLASLRETPAKKSSSRGPMVLLGVILFLAGAISFGVLWMAQKKDREAGSNVAEATPPPASSAPLAVAQDAAPTDPEPEIEIEASLDAAVATSSDAGEPSRRKKHSRRSSDDDEADEEEPDDDSVPADRPGAIVITLQNASTIEIDGEPVARSSRGGRFDVEPGDHLVFVRAPGHETVVRSVDVPPGGVAILSIEDDLGSTE